MIKCWYHSADLDGKCCGGILHYHFPEAEMHGIDYGEAFPFDSLNEDDMVFMLDFCLEPFGEMLKLASCVKNLIWIDHHQDKLDEYKTICTTPYLPRGYDPLRRIDVLERLDGSSCVSGIGACASVWTHMFPGRDMPLPVKLLAQADVRDYSDSRTLDFKYGMAAQTTNPDNVIWRRLFEEPDWTDIIVNEGKAIRKFVRVHDKEVASRIAFESEFMGLKLIVGNKAKSNSAFLRSLYDEEKHDAMACFHWIRDRWTIDFYTNREDLDLSDMCKQMVRGGLATSAGGHKKAAGCVATLEGLMRLLKWKS